MTYLPTRITLTRGTGFDEEMAIALSTAMDVLNVDDARVAATMLLRRALSDLLLETDNGMPQ